MKDNRKDLKIDWNEFLRWFDATMKRYGSIIPAPKFLTTGKKAQVQRLVNQFGSKEILAQAVVNMARSDVCNGRVITAAHPKGLKGSFEWLTSHDEILAKAANGFYDNIPEQPLTAAELRAQAEEQRRLQQEQRREEARRIEAEELERRRRERDAMFAGAVHGEELQKILAQIQLPPLEKPNNEKKSQKQPP